MLIWEEVEVYLHKEAANIKESLANGSASTMEEYKQQVGKIEGIQLSIHALKDIIKKRLHEDDVDNE